MQNYASVFRTGEILKEGCEKIYEIYDEMEDLKVCIILFKTLLNLYKAISSGKVSRYMIYSE